MFYSAKDPSVLLKLSIKDVFELTKFVVVSFVKTVKRSCQF